MLTFLENINYIENLEKYGFNGPFFATSFNAATLWAEYCSYGMLTKIRGIVISPIHNTQNKN